MYNIATYRERIRTLTHDRDTVRFALDISMEREKELKNDLTGFNRFGLQMQDKLTNITKPYFVAVVGHLDSQG